MQSSELEHIHNHFLWIQDQLRHLADRLDGFDTALRDLARLEIITSVRELSSMAKQSDAINQLGGRFDSLAAVATDIKSDFEAFRDAMEAERENLSDEGQAALDAAAAKADAAAQKLADLDTEVGDADGSDTTSGTTEPGPSGGEGTGQPAEGGVDQAPPAGEGTVVNPDEQGFGDTDAQPTA
jgi:chromosome segregation ATPase